MRKPKRVRPYRAVAKTELKYSETQAKCICYVLVLQCATQLAENSEEIHQQQQKLNKCKPIHPH